MIVIVVILLLSFLISLALLPRLITGLHKRKIVVKDYYKKQETWVATHGGVLILFICVLSVTLYPLLFWIARAAINYWPLLVWLEREPDLLPINQLSAIVILSFGIYGLLDDYMDVGRPSKVLVPFLFTAPLVVFAAYSFIVDMPLFGQFPRTVEFVLPLIGPVRADIIYRFIIVPFYIVVVSNLVNMHSGFNGLACGTSAIVIGALVIKSLIIGSTGNIITVGAVLGAIVALWVHNFYPSRIFEGNAGALMIGATLGCVIVIHGFIFSAFIMLIPHTVNFLMYVYWRIRRKLAPSDERFKVAKFGRLREDGTLEVPNRLTLKWVLPYKYRMTERQAVLAMYALTGVFCVVGVIVPF